MKMKLYFCILFFVTIKMATCAKGQKCTAEAIIENGPIRGKLTIRDMDGFMRLEGKFSGLEPGAHPFHIHKYGDISNNCSNAGEIYNPLNETLACPGSIYLFGDLHFLTAGNNGKAVFFADRVGQITHPFNISGLSLMIHPVLKMEPPVRDPERTGYIWPIGFPIQRIACGVITASCNYGVGR